MSPSSTEKDISPSDVEEQRIEAMDEKTAAEPNLKLDSNGLPLVPQPSDHKDDPLVRSSLRICQTEGLLALTQIIAELATMVQILCSALTLPSCVYRSM